MHSKKRFLRRGFSAEVDIEAIVETDSIGQCGARILPKKIVIDSARTRRSMYPAWAFP